VTAFTATASVGDTMAPRANAIASGSPGTSQWATRPTRGRERDQPDREDQDGALGPDEFAQRHQPAVGEKERRQEAQEEEAAGRAEPGESPAGSAAPIPPMQVGDELRPRQPKRVFAIKGR
jgi:hypothetical protein